MQGRQLELIPMSPAEARIAEVSQRADYASAQAAAALAASEVALRKADQARQHAELVLQQCRDTKSLAKS